MCGCFLCRHRYIKRYICPYFLMWNYFLIGAKMLKSAVFWLTGWVTDSSSSQGSYASGHLCNRVPWILTALWCLAFSPGYLNQSQLADYNLTSLLIYLMHIQTYSTGVLWNVVCVRLWDSVISSLNALFKTFAVKYFGRFPYMNVHLCVYACTPLCVWLFWGVHRRPTGTFYPES